MNSNRAEHFVNGTNAHRLISELYPICRSITGDGVRETLGLLQKRIPLEIHEVPTGTPVFDWTVPREWNIRDAYIKDIQGHRIVDFKESNLHVVNYSMPIRRRMNLSQLQPYLHSLPDRPEWIPYKTSYYQETWGFCLSHNQLQELQEGMYDVVIDAELSDGCLTYGEFVLPGLSSEEVLLSCHVCHPSMCNDNLSGIALAVLLAEKLSGQRRRYTYRFLFVPGTIGAITWLAGHRREAEKIVHGMVLTGLGDPGGVTYKKSRRGNAIIDRAAEHVLRHSGQQFAVLQFSPYGYDERQYCSPGFNLPVGRLSRTPFGEYPQYHTSADNLDFVTVKSLDESFAILLQILNVLECDEKFINRNPFCEPQLGKRGLYESIGADELAMLWTLNLSDGHHSLLDIAERSGLEFHAILNVSRTLEKHGLLKKVD